MSCAAPPSEPYVRFSRIRLSSRWFTVERIDRPSRGLRQVRTAQGWQSRHLASFHSLFKSRQHASRPDTGVSKRPKPPHLRRVYPGKELLPGVVPEFSCHASTFLRPLASPSFPGFHTTMDALTPVRLSRTGQISLLNVTLPSDHSVPNHLIPPCHRFSAHAQLSVTGLPHAVPC